jgi:hypothetical protein
VNELIAFYLDTVISELERNPESRATLSEGYEAYRSLEPPKPTYYSFISDNARDVEWCRARLRLLQLLGETSSYNVDAVLSRLQPYEQELVSEMIILNGRQERHEEALKLLTHGLGDYNTAINYCLYGYASIHRPATTGGPPVSHNQMPIRAEQSRMFRVLLQEFLKIGDLSQRVERTSELLERFGGWLDVADVLAIVPDEWSVDAFSGFLIQALRKLVRDKAESDILRALSDALNSQMSSELVEKRDELGATFERVA